MGVVKGEDHMVNDYKISEGDAIGYLPTEFGDDGNLNEKTIKAGVDVKKGQVVELTGELTVQPTSGASDKVLGVAMFDAKAGNPVSVETEGLFKLVASSAITAPTHVVSAKDGKVASAGSGGSSIGIAITNASTDGFVYVKFSI